MAIVVLNTVLSIAFLAAVIWALRVLAELRRGQRAVLADLARLAEGLGLPPKPQPPTIICDHCGAAYDAELSGCTTCGRAKPKHAVPDAPTAPAARSRQG